MATEITSDIVLRHSDLRAWYSSVKNIIANLTSRLCPSSLSRLYMICALPTLILMSLIISPFGSNDETQHFLRIVSILEGYVIPEVAIDNGASRLDKRIAGGHVGQQVVNVADEVDYGRSGARAGFKMSRSKIEKAMLRYDTPIQIFAEHSNTALYPPFLYTAPIIAIAFCKMINAPILSWLYAGRIANSILACLICWLAIKRGRGIAHLLLIISCLPIFLFQIASVSADALMLPLFLLFATMLTRLAGVKAMTQADTIVLAMSTILLAVGKVAYLPIAILPVIFLWPRRKTVPRLYYGFVAVFMMSAIGWAIWAYLVHDKVFSMRPDVIVDPVAQLRLFIERPIQTLHMFFTSMMTLAPSILIDAIGRKLGYETIRIPAYVCLFLASAVALGSLIKTADIEIRQRNRISVVIIASLCICAIFVLIYLQFNEVGAPFVLGIQGRYFTPLLVLVSVFMPSIIIRRRHIEQINLVSALVAISSAVCTVSLVYARYWLA